MIYADELGDEAAELTFTREPPEGWAGHTGRIDASLLEGGRRPSGVAFICGSNGFVEARPSWRSRRAIGTRQVLTERFGPTG